MRPPLYFLIFFLFLSTQAQAFVDCFRPLSKQSLAVKKYSPFPEMFWTSQLATLAVISELPQNSHERHKMGNANAIAGTMWSTGLIIGFASSGAVCPPNPEVHFEDIKEEDISGKSYLGTQRLFYIYHSINTAWMLVDASYSSKKNKYQTVAAGVLSPFFVDLINRTFFNRHKKSIFWQPPEMLVEEALLIPSPGKMELSFKLSF